MLVDVMLVTTYCLPLRAILVAFVACNWKWVTKDIFSFNGTKILKMTFDHLHVNYRTKSRLIWHSKNTYNSYKIDYLDDNHGNYDYEITKLFNFERNTLGILGFRKISLGYTKFNYKVPKELQSLSLGEWIKFSSKSYKTFFCMFVQFKWSRGEYELCCFILIVPKLLHPNRITNSTWHKLRMHYQ